MGSVGVRSEVYAYRTRVQDYRPRKRQQVDIVKRVELVQKKLRREREAVIDGGAGTASGSADAPVGVEEMMSELVGSGGQEATSMHRMQHHPSSMLSTAKAVAHAPHDEDGGTHSPIRETRRKIFADNLENIHNQTTSSDTASAAFRVPPLSEYRQVMDELYGQPRYRPENAEVIVDILTSDNRAGERPGSEASVGEVGNRPGPSVGEASTRPAKGTLLDKAMSVQRDDGFSLVTAEDYVEFRLMPTVHAYRRRAMLFSRINAAIQAAKFLLVSITSALSLFGQVLWIPLVVAASYALTSAGDFEQLTNKLRNINQALLQLENLCVWWESLSMVEKRQPNNKEYLVVSAEKNMDAEVSAFMKTLRASELKPGQVEEHAAYEGQPEASKKEA